MKKNIILIAAAAIGIALAFAFVTQGSAKALSVNEVSSDPAAFAGTITVTGIMGGVSQQDPTIFGIMDKKELQCTTPNCNKVFIPVKFQGKLPVLGDEVNVTGRFARVGDGFVFAAEKMKVVRNHKIGG